MAQTQKRQKKKKKNYIVFFEVLQNGEYLDAATRPYGKKASIVLSSKKGALVLPFYPLSHDIEIASIDKNGVHIYLDSRWEGFLTEGGKPIQIDDKDGEEQVYTLGPGDYGAITKHDLRLLIKIGEPKIEKKVPISKAYRGKWLDLLIDSKSEANAITFSIALCLIFFSAIIAGLMMRPDDSPSHRKDLDPSYNLAFVYPDHLKNLPEALQKNLDRTKPIESSMKYYQSMSEIFLGYDPKFDNYIFKNTAIFYDRIYDKYQYEIDALTEKQVAKNDQIKAKKQTALVTIPSIKGETFAGSMIRLTGKMKSLHKTFEESLEVRRETTKKFNADHGYNFEEYKQKANKGKSVSKIAKIRVFTLVTNEVLMYREASDLALKAKAEQKRVLEHSDKREPLSAENTEPIGIKPSVDYVSFDGGERFSDNEKLRGLSASSFGRSGKNKIKEPLIGEIDPQLIEDVINKYRFQLQLCFELALRRNRNLKGKMEWTWRVDTRGKISDLVLNSTTIKDRSMKRCVRHKISRWVWPKPRNGSVEVTYPFEFRSSKG